MRCDTCKFGTQDRSRKPCKSCVYNTLADSTRSYYQPATLEAMFAAAKPWKPRRKELQAEIEILEAVVAAKENTINELHLDFDANQESLYFNTRVEIDALKKQLAAKDAEIARLESAWLVDEAVQPDGNLRPAIRTTLARHAQELAAKQGIIDEQAAELYEALATCTELAERGEEWVKLYVWGRR